MKNSTNMYFLGEAERRRSAVARAATTDAAEPAESPAGSSAVHVCTNAAGLEAAVTSTHTSDLSGAHNGGNGISTSCTLTAESGIFPCLFPHGEGFNTGAMRMLDYIKLRWQQLFSPFSLLKTYALVMAQVIMATNREIAVTTHSASLPTTYYRHAVIVLTIKPTHFADFQMNASGGSAVGISLICMQFQLFEKNDRP